MPTARYLQRFRRASAACGVACAAFGLSALMGWVLDNELLRGSFGAGITTKTNAALCLTLMGVLVVSVAADSERLWRRRLEQACALLVSTIGALTLMQHVFGVDFGIDQLLFREEAGATATQSPNRMGPIASSCSVLLGVAYLGLNKRTSSGRAPFQYLVLAVILITSVSLLGYLFDARALFGIGKYTGIALPTALSLWIVAVGLLLARPDVGFMRRLAAEDSGALLVRRLLPAAIVIPIMLMLLRIAGQHLGLYEQTVGRALLVLGFIVVFTGMVWRTGEVVHRQAADAARAELALHERLVHSLEQFRTLGEAVPDLLWMTDASGGPLYQNPAWKRYTGLDARALEDMRWDSLAHPEDRAMMQELWDEARLQGTPFQLEARLRGSDGTHRWFSLRIVPVRDETNHVTKWIGAGTDIDDQKRTQDALADADRRKTEFLAVLAHELRNPLAPVRNAVHLLRSRGDADREAARAYAIIERQIEQLAHLIDDLMDVSRISRDRLELRKSHVGLTKIIAGAVESSRYVVDAHRHELSISLPPDEVILEADAARLVQVFTNLLTNAARYTPPGGQITLTATHGDLPSDSVIVSVTDTGVGIDEEQRPHLFEMFFQGERENGRGRHGLGIGLSLVKKLVELHGGSVSAESAGRGRGSTFTVRLPPSMILRSIEAPPSRPVPGKPAFGGISILVVEDNQDSAEMLTQLLELTGASVHTAHDGETALTLGAEAHPHIILLDIGLPGISGYEVAREARRTRWGAHAFIVALTGWGQPDDRARSKDAGFNRHLVKPVNPETLMTLIDDFKRGSASSGPHGAEALTAAS